MKITEFITEDISDFDFVWKSKRELYVFPKGTDHSDINNAAGWVSVLNNGNGTASIGDATIHQEFRRQGLASEMYKRLAAAGYNIVKSDEVSAMGQSMWSGFNRKGLAKGDKFVAEDDAEHQEALEKTGFWGKQAAGCIFLAMDTKRLCLNHRSRDVEQPGTWGTWGGAIDSGENPMVACQREVREESGYTGPLKMIPLYVFSHPSGFKYYNFLAIVKTEFVPVLDWESQGYSWVNFGKWPKPMHPGLVSVLKDPASVATIKLKAQGK